MKNETTTVWITKYALTKGIFTAWAIIDDNMIKVGRHEYYHGNDWHTDEKSAWERAEQMRHKKIHSLKKQIARLETLQIPIITP